MESSESSFQPEESLRALELREMLEEEHYLQTLRVQRERIEEFVQDAKKKEALAADLKTQLEEAHQALAGQQRLQLEVTRLTTELKAQETANEEVREAMKRQLEDYQASLTQLQQVVAVERDERSQEIRELRDKLTRASATQD